MLIPPTFLEINGMRFLITGMPKEYQSEDYKKLYEGYYVTDVVRTCEECHYSDEFLRALGIEGHEMVFTDGSIPPPEIVQRFVDLCHQRFGPNAENPKATISIHCMAGLGRAPTLVTIALIESGMSNVDAIQTIKKYRPEALNQRQLIALSRYRPMKKSGGCCVIV